MSERYDIEMAFVRILSTGGLVLSGEISAEDKRERIRITILQRKLTERLFDATLTYGEAFYQCYKRPAEMRRMPRDAEQRPQLAIATRAHSEEYPGPGEPGDDDAGDEDDDEG